jgi:cytochrome P450
LGKFRARILVKLTAMQPTLLEKLPNERARRMVACRSLMRAAFQRLYEKRRHQPVEQDSRDLFSCLSKKSLRLKMWLTPYTVRANQAALDAKGRLTDLEVRDQATTLIFTGVRSLELADD